MRLTRKERRRRRTLILLHGPCPMDGCPLWMGHDASHLDTET